MPGQRGGGPGFICDQNADGAIRGDRASEKSGASLRAFFICAAARSHWARRGGAMADGLDAALRPERRTSERVTRIVGVNGVIQSREKIFLALAREFLLRRLEARDARGNFFPLGSGVVLLFGHAHPF